MSSPRKRIFLSTLRPHPQNVAIFGDPQQAEQYQDIKLSIGKYGVLETIVVDQDGQVVVGCLRLACLRELYGDNPQYSVEVEIRQFGSFNEVVTCMVEANIRRRAWSPQQYAAAFHALKQTLRQDGGVLQQRGRPKKDSASGPFSAPSLKTDEEAAKRLQIGKHRARALEVVFFTPGVSQDLKDSVNAHRLSPTAAAKLVKNGEASRCRSKRQTRNATSETALPPDVSELNGTLQRRLEAAAKLIAQESLGEGDATMVARTVHDLMLAMLNALIDTVTMAGHPELAPALQRTKRGWLLRDVA
jgi:hypothetical protein